MAIDATELDKAKADIEAAAPETNDDLVKSLVGIVDRMTKSASFGDTDKAHNGNKYDKSAPKGDAGSTEGYDDADDEEEPDGDGAKGRVARSVSRSRGSNSEMPTALNKSEGDDDEDEEPAEKSGKKDKDLAKSEAEDEEDPETLTERSLYKSIARGKGPAADDYRAVVDASDAIQYLTDSLVKSIAAESAARAQQFTSIRKELRTVKKALAQSSEFNVLMAKSMARILSEQETLIKSEAGAKAPKSDGRVVVIAKADEKTAAGEFSKTALLKSLSRALASGTVDPATTANVTANLDAVQDVKTYWASLPKAFTDAVAAAGAV